MNNMLISPGIKLPFLTTVVFDSEDCFFSMAMLHITQPGHARCTDGEAPHENPVMGRPEAQQNLLECS